MELTLHLVRHGETAWNAEGRMQGSVDVPLNDTGRGQAQAAASALAHRPIGAVISSDLSRARETAEAIAGPQGLEVITDPALRERAFGVVEGRLYEEAKAEYGDRWDVLLHGNEDHFDGGESTHQHYVRVAAFMDALLAAPPAAEIALVSHAGTVRRTRAFLRGGCAEEDWEPVANGGVITLTFETSSHAGPRSGSSLRGPGHD
jgi:probable phosphoglycerate mutase